MISSSIQITAGSSAAGSSPSPAPAASPKARIYHGLDPLRGAEKAGEAQQARRAGPVQARRRRPGADAESEVEGGGAAGRVCLGHTLDVER